MSKRNLGEKIKLQSYNDMFGEDENAEVGKYLCEMDREVLCVINLKTDGTPINCNIVSIGAIDETVAHPREIFKSSILCNASRMMLVHNHRRKGMLTY